MKSNSRVVWTQGMFLMPHHFQHESRHVEYLIEMRARAGAPHAWGHTELALDEAQLAQGRIGISRASGLLPDGTPFSIPQLDEQPAGLEIPPDLKGEIIYLAVPRAREGVTQISFDEQDATALFRWRSASAELRDNTNAGDEPEPVLTGTLALRLLRQRNASEAFALLGVARVLERRSDGQLVLDRNYIPPQTRIDASLQLSAHASMLHGLIRQRARALAARFGQLSHGVSEMADFLMLQALNRAEPVFRQLALAPSVHPFELHRCCLQLAGDLASFTSETRQPPEYPLYLHDDLQASFAPLLIDLRRMLSTVMDRNAVQLELAERSHGVRLAVLPDGDLLRSSNLVLAVNAQMPAEQLRSRFPERSKLGPADRLVDLVNLNLPGLGLRLLPVAPRQLPFHAGFHYFELDRGSELWKQLERSGSLALHVAGDFPALELELWAIRQ